MDPETGVGSGVADPSVDANKRKSRRKSTVAHIPQEVVDFTQLSDADRRLAEMGYVQVSSALPPSSIHRSNDTEYVTLIGIDGTARLTRVPLGLQTRILLALLRLLRPFYIGPLRFHHHDLYLPSGSWRRFLCRMVLVNQWFRLLLHRPLCR